MRPWAQYFCCMVTGNRDFVRRHPVAAKRALRAILKAADICALEPERAARVLVDGGYVREAEYARQLMRDLPWGKWVGIEPRRAHWVEIDQATFPRAPLRSCTVGFPQYSSDLGFPPEAFPTQRRLKRWLAYTPPRVGLPPGSSFKDGSSDPRR
jgi:ABC-type nitrate/sulfonate/bicarbonate transport system substrate-binding protein